MQIFTLQLTEQELGIIGKTLGQQPYNQVADVINKINIQVVEQLKKQEDLSLISS